MKALLSFAFLFVTAFAFSHTEPAFEGTETIKMRVQSYQVPCGSGQCYLVQKGASIGMDNWETLTGAIEGLNYEAGYVYDITVRIERVPNAPEGQQFKHVLVEIIAKQAAG